MSTSLLKEAEMCRENFKELLMEAFSTEDQLKEIVKACLRKIFGKEHSEAALSEFDEACRNLEYMNFLENIKSINGYSEYEAKQSQYNEYENKNMIHKKNRD